MSGLLFLVSVIGFILIAYWAFRNDAMGLNENGSGLLAMRSSEPKPKPAPKWKKQPEPVAAQSPRLLGRLKADGTKKPRWSRALLPGRGR
jgi:hypothetical protein